MKSVECGCKLATKPTKSKEHGGRGGSKDKNLGRIASPLHQDHKATLQLGGLELKKQGLHETRAYRVPSSSADIITF